MSEPQWTPGPWAVKWETNVFGGERLVAGTGGHTSNISDVEPENRANANLIAAAPELLEELEETLAWLKSMHALHPEFEPMMVNRAISRSTRALARARGEVTP